MANACSFSNKIVSKRPEIPPVPTVNKLIVNQSLDNFMENKLDEIKFDLDSTKKSSISQKYSKTNELINSKMRSESIMGMAKTSVNSKKTMKRPISQSNLINVNNSSTILNPNKKPNKPNKICSLNSSLNSRDKEQELLLKQRADRIFCMQLSSKWIKTKPSVP